MAFHAGILIKRSTTEESRLNEKASMITATEK